MDYNNIFRLVDDSTGTNSDVTIEIGASSEVGVQGVELSGMSEMIVGSSQFISTVFTPSNATNKQVTYATSGSSVEVLNNGLGGLTVRATELPNPALGDTEGTVTVVSYDNNSATSTLKIKVHNYATDVTLGARSVVSIPVGASVTINPTVLLENNDFVSNYKVSGKTFDAAELTVDGIYIPMQGGADIYEPAYGNYVTVTKVGNATNDIVITNNSTLPQTILLRVKVTSNILDVNKKNIEKTFDIQLQPSVTPIVAEDKYVKSGTYNKESGNIELTRSDNEVVNVDLGDELGWYEGE